MNLQTKFKPHWLWLSIEAMLLCVIVLANSALCILGLKLYDQACRGCPLPWLSRRIFHSMPYDPMSILACWIVILSTFIALGIVSTKEENLSLAVHLPITTTLAFVLLLYSVLIAAALPHLIIYDGLFPADYISPVPQSSISPWIWLMSSGIYAITLNTFAWKSAKISRNLYMKSVIPLLLFIFLTGCASTLDSPPPDQPVFSMDQERILSICYAAIREKNPDTDPENLQLQQIVTRLNPDLSTAGNLLDLQKNTVTVTFREKKQPTTQKETTRVQGKSITVTLNMSGEVLHVLEGKFSSYSSSTSNGTIKTMEKVMKMNFQAETLQKQKPSLQKPEQQK